MDKVSIIIPVYNVEKYLERCLISVIDQTYKNIEVLLVDDGSTDKSGEICDLYEKKDERIKVIHKKNSGLSGARNVGISKCSGKYLCFIDSDDFVDKDYVKKLYSLMAKTEADLAICNYEKGKGDTFTKSCVKKEKIIIFQSKQMLKQWHGKYKHIETVAWNKMYKRKLFIDNKIRYPEGYYNEDVQTTHLLVEASNKIIVTTEKLYYYYQRSNSIANTISIKAIEDNIFSQIIRLSFFKNKHYISSFHRLEAKLQKYYMYIYCSIDDENMKEIKTVVWEKYRKNLRQVIFYKETKWIEKLLFLWFYFFHLGISKIYKCIKGIK